MKQLIDFMYTALWLDPSTFWKLVIASFYVHGLFSRKTALPTAQT